jgi:glycogen operon protein
MLMVFNAHHDIVNFKLPEAPGGERWRCAIDTNLPTREDLTPFAFGSEYMVTGRSFLMFLLEPSSGKASTAAARRAFAHVSEAFLQASIERVQFAPEPDDDAHDDEASSEEPQEREHRLDFPLSLRVSGYRA